MRVLKEACREVELEDKMYVVQKKIRDLSWFFPNMHFHKLFEGPSCFF